MKQCMILMLFLIIIPLNTISQTISGSNFNDQYSQSWSKHFSEKENNEYDLLFNWQSVPIPGGSRGLSIFFADSIHGWLSDNAGGVARSIDGGNSWDTLTFRDTSLTPSYNSIYFINQNTGWTAGSSMQIRKTTNGGLTWFKQYGPQVPGDIYSVYFFDANTGFIFGGKNYPNIPFGAKTSNGGSSWTELTLSFAGRELDRQYWINSQTAWIAGSDILLETTNGGQTFIDLISNVPPVSNGHNYLLSVYFANQLTGYIGGTNIDKQNIYKTTNGGTNWIFQPNPVSINNSYVQINDVEFLSADSGWAVHGTPYSGAIMFTTNGGSTWVTEEGSTHWFNSLCHYGRKKAWTCADGTVWISNLQLVGLSQNGTEIPNEFKLYQNFPNPFNPSTKIKFSLPDKSSDIKFSVFDVLGRSVKEYSGKNLKPGNYEFDFDGSDLPSGVYFYRLESGLNVLTNKMVLLK